MKLNTEAALIAAAHARRYLGDVVAPEDLAQIGRLPVEQVLDALRSGELPGRHFPGSGWRVSKRAALAWIEGRLPEEVTHATS